LGAVEPELIEEAFNESPLFVELLRLFESGDLEGLESSAKRQHFVPRFLLAHFATDRDGKELLFQLDVESGEAREVETRSAASKRYFYASLDEQGVRSNRMEGLLSLVEGHAAEALQRLLADPPGLALPDRATLSFFFALQDARTPAAAERMAAISDTTMRLLLANQFTDTEAFTEAYIELFGEASEETIEEFRLDVLRRLDDGSVGFANEREMALNAGLGLSVQLATTIFALDWRLLTKEHAFVGSDRGLAMHDPDPPYPFSAQSWRSSHAAQTTIPLSSDAVLLLWPLSFGTDVQEVEGEGARCLNLRTLGWAAGYIYGKSEELVRSVYEAARANPDGVVRPKPRMQILLLDADPVDTSLAEANEAEGRPRLIEYEGVEHDYVVIRMGENPLEVAAAIDRKVEERARRQLGIPEGQTMPGRIRLDLVDPRDLT